LHGYTAVIRVTGSSGQLEQFRERVRWLLVRDIDAGDYTEHHAAGRLEYRFVAEKGIPFPAFATASAEYPGLRVQAEWRNEMRALAGQAVIEGGRLLEQSSGSLAQDATGVLVEVAPDGELTLAMVWQDGRGYAATAHRQAYFRFAQGRLEAIEPDQALEDLALGFAAGWLWYNEAPEEETAVERQRYAAYGYPVRGANLRSEALARLRRCDSLRFCTLSAEALPARDALLALLRNG
jgi:hypothetical protein